MKRESVRRAALCLGVLAVAISVCLVFFRPEEPVTFELDELPDSEYRHTVSMGADIIGDGITVSLLPDRVVRGETAEVRFLGEAETEYEIRVYYASGMSTSKSLLPTVSGNDGSFGWSWRISGNARTGMIRVIVTGGDCRVSFEIEIV